MDTKFAVKAAALKFGAQNQAVMRSAWFRVLPWFSKKGRFMISAGAPKLTPRDFAILETMLADHLGGDELLISAIRTKLGDGKIVFADDLPRDVVTIGSRVAFTVDDRWPQERRLVTLAHYVPSQGHQSVASLIGIGLLGHAAGDKVEFDFGGRSVALEIHDVLYQPEAESKACKRPADLRLVASRDDSQPRVPHRSAHQPGDDPGPSAA
jgi:hypothetical protein